MALPSSNPQPPAPSARPPIGQKMTRPLRCRHLYCEFTCDSTSIATLAASEPERATLVVHRWHECNAVSSHWQALTYFGQAARGARSVSHFTSQCMRSRVPVMHTVAHGAFHGLRNFQSTVSSSHETMLGRQVIGLREDRRKGDSESALIANTRSVA